MNRILLVSFEIIVDIYIQKMAIKKLGGQIYLLPDLMKTQKPGLQKRRFENSQGLIPTCLSVSLLSPSSFLQRWVETFSDK